MRRMILLVTIFAACSSMAGRAVADLVDQSYPNPSYPPTVGEFGINLDNSIGGGVGETFTPTLTSLDFFTLSLQDIHPSNGSGGSFLVEILGPNRQTVLGTSATVNVADSYGIPPAGGFFPLAGAPVRFTFASPVSLTPGASYEAVVLKASGDSFYVIGQEDGTYAGGSYSSSPFGHHDVLYFVEGIASVPEPPSAVLIGLGSAAIVGFRAWTRRQAAGLMPR